MTIAALSATLMLTTACSVLPGLSGDLSTNGPCPDGWKAAVLWSTQEGDTSVVGYVKPDNTVIEQRLAWIGWDPSPSATIDRQGRDVVVAANGNANYDETHLVTLSTDTCAATEVQVSEPAVTGVGVGPDSVYTTNWLNGSAWIRKHDHSGAVVAEKEFPNMMLTKPVMSDRAVLVFATDDANKGRPVLLILDTVSLTEQRRLPLDEGVGGVLNALVHDNVLYYPHTGTNESEGTRLGMVDLATMQKTDLALEKPGPYVLALSGDSLYIGHTALGPAFRPMTDYVWITRYTPATGKTETFDIGTEAGIGVNAITTTDDTLYILGTGTDEEQVTLLAYNLPDMTERSRTTIHRPTGYGHRYPAGLIVP